MKHFTTIFSNVKFNENKEPARYQSYNAKIGDAISQSIQSILNRRKFCLTPVRASPGIQNALLVYDDGRTLTTGLDDQLGVVANLQALLTFCNELSKYLVTLVLARQDAVSVVSVEMAKQLVIIHRVGSASLLTICRRNKDPSVYNLAIGTSVDLLDRGTYKFTDLKYSNCYNRCKSASPSLSYKQKIAKNPQESSMSFPTRPRASSKS